MIVGQEVFLLAINKGSENGDSRLDDRLMLASCSSSCDSGIDLVTGCVLDDIVRSRCSRLFSNQKSDFFKTITELIEKGTFCAKVA